MKECSILLSLSAVSLLKDLKHANIVTLHDIVHTDKSLTLVFEYLVRQIPLRYFIFFLWLARKVPEWDLPCSRSLLVPGSVKCFPAIVGRTVHARDPEQDKVYSVSPTSITRVPSHHP